MEFANDDQRLDLTGMLDSIPMESFDVPPLQKHDLVLINGLQAKPQYNGRLCTLGNMVKDSGRYNVFFQPPYDDEEGIRLKPSNLIWVANKSTWAVKGAMVCVQEYMYSYMIMYRDSYAALPTIDMASIAHSIASNQNVQFEDRTAQLEQLQIDVKHHSWLASRIFLKAGMDAMESNGKLMILFRRTLLSNAAFMSHKLTTLAIADPDNNSKYGWDFMMYFKDDYLKSEKGPELTEQLFIDCVRTVLGLKDMTCSICHDSILGYTSSGTPDNIMTPCGHMFHIECFQKYMCSYDAPSGMRNIGPYPCPNCRALYAPEVSDGRFAMLVGDAATAQDAIDRATHGSGNRAPSRAVPSRAAPVVGPSSL